MPFCPVGKNISNVLNSTYRILQKDMINSMKKITLKSIVDDYHIAVTQ